MFGKATGSAHNIERSTGMLRQLESVGIFDNAAGRSLLNSHLESVYSGTKGIFPLWEHLSVFSFLEGSDKRYSRFGTVWRIKG